VNRYIEIWGADVTKFRPERWIGDDRRPKNTGGVESNYAHMRFLHGPRACSKQGFAKAEFQYLLAAFVCKFQWALDMEERDMIPKGVITIKLINGMHLKLRPAA